VTTERWATAFHEAGHAVIGDALGLVVEKVTILPVFSSHYKRWARGMTWIKATGDLTRDFSFAMRDRLHREAIFSLAGPAAERRAVGHVPLDAEDIDAQVAEWLLSRDTAARELPRVFRRANGIAERLVRQRWSAIESLAAALMRHGSLSGQQLRKSPESAVKNVGCRAVSRPEVPMRLGEPSP